MSQQWAARHSLHCHSGWHFNNHKRGCLPLLKQLLTTGWNHKHSPGNFAKGGQSFWGSGSRWTELMLAHSMPKLSRTCPNVTSHEVKKVQFFGFGDSHPEPSVACRFRIWEAPQWCQKFAFFIFYHWNCGFENWLFLPCLHPCSPSCSSPSLSSLLCSFLSSLGLLLPLLLAILTLLLSKPSFHNTFENWSFCVSMCMALPEARGTIPLLLAIQKLGSANSPSWFLQQIHRLALPGDAGGPEDHGQAGPLESQSKAWTATPSPPRTCSPVWPAHLTRHSPENLERHFALVRLSDWASWGLLSPELSSPSYWGFQLQFPHSSEFGDMLHWFACLIGQNSWVPGAHHLPLVCWFRWSHGSAGRRFVVIMLNPCVWPPTCQRVWRHSTKHHEPWSKTLRQVWTAKPWELKLQTARVCPKVGHKTHYNSSFSTKTGPIFGFSPHYCVGFLFFAWIPPLSSAAVRRRAALTTHLSEWVREEVSEWVLTHSLTHGCLLRGRRNTQSLLEELRRAWPPLARGCLLRGRRSTKILLEELPRAWPPVARGCLLRGRCSTQSLLAELRRAWPSVARGCLLRGRRSTRGAAARVAAAGPRLPFAWQAQYTQSLLDELRRAWPPLGPRLPFAWQAQYTEPPGRAAARVAAAGAAAAFRVAGAVHRWSWKPATAFCVAGAVHTASWWSCGARGRCWPAAASCVAGAVHKASWTSCGARGRRWGRGCLSRGRRSTQSLLEELRRAWPPLGPRLPFAWQAQYTGAPAPASAAVDLSSPLITDPVITSQLLITTHHNSSHLITYQVITAPLLTPHSSQLHCS